MTGLSKQAKILSPNLISTALSYLNSTRHPDRNKLIFLFSIKGGMRAKEIAHITWSMVLDADGDLVNANIECCRQVAIEARRVLLETGPPDDVRAFEEELAKTWPMGSPEGSNSG